MHHVVVVLVVFYGGKHLATASHLTGELGHHGFFRRLGHLREHVLQVQVPLHIPILEEFVIPREAHGTRRISEGCLPSRRVALHGQRFSCPGLAGQAGI